jgi:hypothetical protein
MARIPVLKTYKIFIGGQFPRTESGRYYPLCNAAGRTIANVCLSSRKDARNAVVAARGAFADWSARAAFNRGQILYRMAEMLETRRAQFVEELNQQGITQKAASDEVSASVDRLVHYAGWCDKYQALFGTVNPVASSHFNFSVPEPTGVVGIFAPEESGLLGLVSLLAPALAGGNTVVAVASESKPLCAVTLAEVMHASDTPAGVVNILTGKRSELLPHLTAHMDVNAVVFGGHNTKEWQEIQALAPGNVKRVVQQWNKNWNDSAAQSPYHILDTQEIKTTWHPIERITPSGSKY